MNELHERVQSIAAEAGEKALDHFRQLTTLNVESKGPLDLVTAADRDVERFIAERLALAFPGDGLFGEEGSAVTSQSGRVWVIDPIDGTFNFIRGSNDWGISIGLYDNGKPVYGVVNAPARGELFAGGTTIPAMLNGQRLPALRPFDTRCAAVGVGIHPDVPAHQGIELLETIIADLGIAYRVTGSSVISLIDIAKGNVDGYVGWGIPSWDIMGMIPCLQRLGVATTIDWHDSGLETRLRFICGTPGILDLTRKLVA